MILYTDIEPFPCAVVEERASDGGLPPGKVLCADITCIAGGRLRQTLKRYQQIHLFCGIGASPLGLKWAGWPPAGDEWSIVTGGFPCQDISSAGLGAGLDGDRSGLFWEMMRVVRKRKPAWVLAENVGALSTRGLDRVVGAMGEAGYEVHALRLGAWAVGAPHERQRWWVVCRRIERSDAAGVDLANADDGRRGARGREQRIQGRAGCDRRELEAGDRRGRLIPNTDGGRGSESQHPLSPEPRHDKGHDTGGRAQRSASRVDALPEHVGEPGGAGLEGHRADAGSPQGPQPGHAGSRGDSGARELADAHADGLRAERLAVKRTHAEQPGQGDEQLEHADRHEQPGEPVHTRQGQEGRGEADARWGDPGRWPHPPLVDTAGRVIATTQYDWEPQRLYQRRVGNGPDGLSPRLAAYLNKRGVAALGNAQVPQCVMVIARAMLASEKEIRDGC